MTEPIPRSRRPGQPRRALGLSSTLLAAAVMTVAMTACGKPTAPRGLAAPIIGQLESPTDLELTPAQRGRVLLDELSCTACHATPGADPRPGPRLDTVTQRVQDSHLRAFLADPMATTPGTTMPDMFRDLDADARDRAVDAVTAYLDSFTADLPAARGAVNEALDAAATAGEELARGATLFESIGCVPCHGRREGQPTAGKRPLGNLHSKYRSGALEAFLLAPHQVRPGGRMPDFGLSPAEAADLAAYLRSAPTANAVVEDAARTPPPVTRELLAAGREHFTARRCAACHGTREQSQPGQPKPPLPAPAVTDLPTAPDHPTGCLSGATGPWPFYALSDSQRSDIRAALATGEQPLSASERINGALTSRNCVACHSREGLAARATAAAESFGTSDPTLGQDGRVPPTLTGVGAKLQRDWLTHAIAHGQQERPYLDTRMPGFGAVFAKRLAADLAATDELQPLPVTALPEDREAKKKVIELGRELVGQRGMNCITCHYFAGEKIGAMGAIDLVNSTGKRLRPDWFAHFLRDPLRFRPGTLMPLFFPNGQTTRPELGEGDTQRQLDAIWHYLASGRNVREPHGLRRAPIELTATDHAVMLRRSVHGAGKRGISVGYPGSVNLTFDAETLALTQVWWGRFLDVGPVWRSQGHGRAQVLGKPRIELGKGPAFAELTDIAAPWPDASRRELGQQWRGYDLDAEDRPSLRYAIGDIEVVDTPYERRKPDAVTLERRLVLTAPANRSVVFRAASHGAVERLADERLADNRFRIGKHLVITIDGGECHVQQVGETFELRVQMTATPTGQSLVLRYEVTQ